MLGPVGCSGQKDEAEGVALRQLRPLLPTGIMVTADALQTVCETAQALCESSLFYVVEIKGNQPKIDLQLRTKYPWSGHCHLTVNGGSGHIAGTQPVHH